MKTKLRFWILIFTLITLFTSFVGCSAIQKTLNPPAHVRVEGGYVKWDSVDGASSYLVYVDEEEYSTNDNSFRLALVEDLEIGKTYTIYVKAKGDGYLYQMSNASESVSYTHTQDTNDEPSSAPVTDENIVQTLVGLGLGQGVNALTATDVVAGLEERGGSSVFKKDAFSAEDLGQFQIGKTTGESHVASSVMEAIQNINYAHGVSAGAEYSNGMFTAGFENKFGVAFISKEENKKNQYFYQLQQNIAGQNYLIQDYKQTSLFESKLSDAFLSDVTKLRAGTMTASRFFDIYGTHLAMSVSYGATIEVNYAQYSSSTINKSAIKTSIDTAFGVNANAFGQSGSADLSTATKLENSLAALSSTGDDYLKITAVGGNNNVLNTSSFTTMAVGYNDWIQSTADKSTYRLIDVPTGGLRAVWEYIPDEYQEAAEVLKQAFIAAATENANELAGLLEFDEYPAWQTKSEDFTVYNCQLDNGYNKAQSADVNSDDYRRHDGWQMVNLNVYGCNKQGASYKVVNPYEFSLKMKVLQNRHALPAVCDDKTPYITDDGATTSVFGSSAAERIGYGAYYVRITYADHTQSIGAKTYLFENTTAGDFIEILSVKEGYYYIGGNRQKSIENTIAAIEVVVVYEIGIYYNFLDTEHTNWRCEKTLIFA